MLEHASERRTCSTCLHDLPVDAFQPSRRQCRQCRSAYRAEYYARNRRREIAAVASWIKENPLQRAESRRAWQQQNPDKVRETTKRWRRNNPGRVRAYKAARRAKKLQATPAWVDMSAIKRIYDEAAKMPNHECDHVVPLVSPTVCGLNVPWNLRIIPATENRLKSNKYWPYQWD